MNLFLCKCKDNYQEEKNAMDLLNIKNLENSLKNKENKMKFSKYNFLEKMNDIEINNLEDEIEIIDYPYKNKQENNINNNINHILKVKSNIINKNNKIFNSLTQNNIKDIKNKSDLNSSSINSESLIEDNIEYLNDEDSLKESNKENIINLKPIKINNINNNMNYIYNKPTNVSKQAKTDIFNIPSKIQNITTKNSKSKILRNDSFKSGTTKVSTLKKTKTNKRKDMSEKKDSRLRNKLNKKHLDKFNDYKEFKSELNKTFEEFSKSIYSPEKIIQIYNNNDIKIFNNCGTKNIKIKQPKGNTTKNVSKNKRIIKRKVKFKKLNLK